MDYSSSSREKFHKKTFSEIQLFSNPIGSTKAIQDKTKATQDAIVAFESNWETLFSCIFETEGHFKYNQFERFQLSETVTD